MFLAFKVKIRQCPVINTITATSQPFSHTATTQASSVPTQVITPIPTSTSTLPSQMICNDKAIFVNETVPDGSVFFPGESFVKIWTLENIGTCTWTPDYTLVFIKGEQMDGASPSPIGKIVSTNSQIELILPQTAPQNPGTYQGFWKLRNSRGEDFGLGNDATKAFWVKINVVPRNEANNGNLNLGQPTWKDSFDGVSNTFYLGEDSDISFVIKDGRLIMTAFEPSGDQWRVAKTNYLEDFYLETKFKTGPKCSGKDSYGSIVRALDTPNGMINSGYVFGFSCDGKYRIYRMDNGNYNEIENWTSHPGINSGPNQENTMGIRSEGNTLQLYANGVKVFEFTDNAYSSGLFGLMIRSEDTKNLQIVVREIAYWIQ